MSKETFVKVMMDLSDIDNLIYELYLLFVTLNTDKVVNNSAKNHCKIANVMISCRVAKIQFLIYSKSSRYITYIHNKNSLFTTTDSIF